jgi:hypothetical protein
MFGWESITRISMYSIHNFFWQSDILVTSTLLLISLARYQPGGSILASGALVSISCASLASSRGFSGVRGMTISPGTSKLWGRHLIVTYLSLHSREAQRA